MIPADAIREVLAFYVQGNAWTILHKTRSSRQGVLVLARCICGTEREVIRSRVLRGESLSCGCIRSKFPDSPPFAALVVPADAPNFALADRILRNSFLTDRGCWQWAGSIQAESGYGYIRLSPTKRSRVHRVAYESIVGPIPDGLQLDHLCRNRACLNPAHLEPVTSRVNTLRGMTVTAANAAKTHCINGHEFTPANTYVNPRRGNRSCRACSAASARRAKARRAEVGA